MLVSPRQLLDRLRYPRSRADALRELRARFDALPERSRASAAAVASSDALRELREELARALAGVEACSGCARGHPGPAGRWPGGHCCSGDTLAIWTHEECAALKLGGTRPSALRPPAGDHAGCAFRGARGCSLAPQDRPSLCVRYVCSELRAELDASGELAGIARLSAALAREQRRFASLLGARAPGARASREVLP